MRNVNILYDPDTHKYINAGIRKLSDDISKTFGINLNITLDHNNMFEKLTSGPKYDLVILHLPEEDDKGSLKSLVKRIRNNYDGILVAESSSYPYGKDEVLKLFDGYSEEILLHPNQTIPGLLRKHGFLPKPR